MEYYQILPIADNKPKLIYNQKLKRLTPIKGYDIWIANELYTKRELKRFALTIPDNYYRLVNVPKNKTFWFFGARFPFEDEQKRLDRKEA